MDQQPMIISIEGNIGVGKSTLIDNLETYYKNENIQDVIILREPVDAWNLFVDSKDNETTKSLMGQQQCHQDND
jgi:thymidylate kinase